MISHSVSPASKFQRFFDLHGGFFILPTIWDRLSAVAAADAGFAAVATSSVALGYANGILSNERVPFDIVTDRLKQIVEAVHVPVSVDMEDGYPDVTGDIADSIRRIIDVGVVAVNIEDSPGSHSVPLVAAESHARAIARARDAAESAGAAFFINARTDVFLLDTGIAHSRSIDEAIRRANLYVEAGANGVYVPARGLSEREVVTLAEAINAPLTLLAPAESVSFVDWKSAGVKRISLGTVVIRNAYAAIQKQLETVCRDSVISSFAAVDLDAVLRRTRHNDLEIGAL